MKLNFSKCHLTSFDLGDWIIGGSSVFSLHFCLHYLLLEVFHFDTESLLAAGDLKKNPGLPEDITSVLKSFQTRPGPFFCFFRGCGNCLQPESTSLACTPLFVAPRHCVYMYPLCVCRVFGRHELSTVTLMNGVALWVAALRDSISPGCLRSLPRPIIYLWAERVEGRPLSVRGKSICSEPQSCHLASTSTPSRISLCLGNYGFPLSCECSPHPVISSDKELVFDRCAITRSFRSR